MLSFHGANAMTLQVDRLSGSGNPFLPISSRHITTTVLSMKDRISHDHQHGDSSNDNPPAFIGSLNRREAFGRAASFTAILPTALTTILKPEIVSAATTTKAPVRIAASWKATNGLNSTADSQFVAFDPKAYEAMRDDEGRTPLFRKAIVERLESLPGGPSNQTVLDLGTGPFALFAIVAAEAGAKDIIAVEADPKAAKSARDTVKKAGYEKVITVVDGFSSDLTLSSLSLKKKADLVIAEIVGSICTEEGAYATILDAHRRLVERPNDPKSWIPCRMQTYCAPASYTLHSLFRPPGFDWSKLNGEPVRFNCRDFGLGLLSDPKLIEDVSFADIDDGKSQEGVRRNVQELSWLVQAERVEENERQFLLEYKNGRVPKAEVDNLSKDASSSFTGVAMWPRIILDPKEELIVDSRSYPQGDQRRSHWQTVLPIMSTEPVPLSVPGEAGSSGASRITVKVDFTTPDEVGKVPTYLIEGNVYFDG